MNPLLYVPIGIVRILIHMAQARAVVSEAILWHNRAKTWGE